jgi:hypothetical protein
MLIKCFDIKKIISKDSYQKSTCPKIQPPKKKNKIDTLIKRFDKEINFKKKISGSLPNCASNVLTA